jgi:hypothetical protein
MGLKIACLGAAPSSRTLAPFGDPTWEIWACSPPNHDLPRVDAWFEIHNLDRKWIPQNGPWIEVVTRHPRVYIAYPDARLPQGTIYPIGYMVEKWGYDFFASSLSYMLALAIEQKPEEIGLWGVDMSATEEYGHQRPGCKFFMREAEKLGIKVTAAPQSDIQAPCPLYGYKEFSPMWAKQKARRIELKQRLANCDQVIAQKNQEQLIVKGALDDMGYLDNTYCPTAYDPRFMELCVKTRGVEVPTEEPSV